MKVILKETLKTLGAQGDIVNVKDGYSNNFLFPKGYAIMATSSNIKIHEENNRQGALKRAKMKNDAEGLAGSLKDLTLSIGMKAGSNDKIFGSVTPLQISQALKAKGYDIDRRKIELVGDIKTLGTYSAIVNLHRDVAVNIAVEVVAE